MARSVPNVIAEGETPARSSKMNANLSYLAGEIDDVEDEALQNVIEDTTPQLGGNLDVNGKTITSASDGDIEIDPNGTGTIILGATLTTSSNGDITLSPDGTGNIVVGATLTTSSDGDITLSPDGDGTVNLGSLGQNFDVNDNELLNIKRVSFEDFHDLGNSGNSIEVDLSQGQNFILTLTDDCTLTVTNADIGGYEFFIKQNATGEWTLSLPSGYWSGGEAYVATTDANAIDRIFGKWDGTNWWWSVIGLDFSVPS